MKPTIDVVFLGSKVFVTGSMIIAALGGDSVWALGLLALATLELGFALLMSTRKDAS